MKTSIAIGLLASLLCTTSLAANTEPAKITIEHVFNTSAATAWSKLGRFCSITEWQSAVASCLVEERKDGIYRIVVMRNDTAFIERLEDFSEQERHFSYSILSGPLPVTGYHSEIRIQPDATGSSAKLIWRAWYTVPNNENEKKIKAGLEALFNNGIKGMSALLALKQGN